MYTKPKTFRLEKLIKFYDILKDLHYIDPRYTFVEETRKPKVAQDEMMAIDEHQVLIKQENSRTTKP